MKRIIIETEMAKQIDGRWVVTAYWQNLDARNDEPEQAPLAISEAWSEIDALRRCVESLVEMLK